MMEVYTEMQIEREDETIIVELRGKFSKPGYQERTCHLDKWEHFPEINLTTAEIDTAVQALYDARDDL